MAVNTGYTPTNANKASSDAEYQKQKDIYSRDPNHNAAYSNEALLQQMQNEGLSTDNWGYRSQQGGLTTDRNEAIAGGGTGEAVSNPGKTGTWYEKPGIDRQKAEGTSGADEAHLNDTEYAYVQYCKEQYAEAETAGNRAMMVYWHNEAEKTRARSGYSGGTDGSDYFTLGGLGANTGTNGGSGAYDPNAGVSGGGSSSDLKGLLDAWQEAAIKQNDGKVDYAVAKAVADLERALADAQPQFKEQAESVDRDARQAMDNSALYAEMRGDNGGIGQEQYNAIQNTQAQNHLAVQQAQTKLATDTQRQIADLRAQGEFEKANAALEITQSYLQQLIGLEQWAAEYNLSVEQFNASLQQWEAEYNMAMQQLQISQNQWQVEFDAAQNKWQQEFDYTKNLNSTNQLASMGEALLGAGIMPSADQLSAMGMSQAQAQQYITAAQMAEQLKGIGNGNNGGNSAFFDDALDRAEKMAKNGDSPQTVMAYLEGLVDRGQITAEESVHIYMDYLGLPIIAPSRNTNTDSFAGNAVN